VALIAVGLLSVLVFPGTREIALFNLQQVVPAREGSTYYSVWHIPKSYEGCFQDHIQLPRWRLWKGEYERRRGDWRIHAARGCRPSWAWEGGRSAGRAGNPWARVEESERELSEAARLAPDRPELHCAIAMMIMNREELRPAGRWEYRDNVRIPKPDWRSGSVSPARLERIWRELDEAKRLDPGNGFPLIVEAAARFAVGEDSEALAALNKAKVCATVQDYWPRLWRNYSSFLESLGVPTVEAAIGDRPSFSAWQYVLLSTRDVLVAKANAEVASGQHHQVAKLVSLAAVVGDAVESGTGSPPGMLLCLRQLTVAGSAQSEEAQLAASLAYLWEHGESALADRAQALAVGWEAHSQARQAASQRETLLAFRSTGVLIASAVVLLLAIGVTALWLLSTFWPSGDRPEVCGWRRLTLHAFCLLTAPLTAASAEAASFSFQIDIMYKGEPPYEPPALVMCASPLLLLFLGTLMVSITRKDLSRDMRWRGEWSGSKEWLLRGLAVFRQFVLVRAVVYFAFAYIALVWAAHFVRQAAAAQSLG